ncbi:MAG: hypothetical protein LBE13_00350, partial [Bacteroidales bacterium]|nr:hypothetical protein [Bacteroidales bacterium]
MYYYPWIKETNNEYVFYYDLNKAKRLFIVIRFAEDCIRFYWYNTKLEDPAFPENQQLFSIELLSPKIIGNDILNIRDGIRKFIQKKEEITREEEITMENAINDFIKEFALELDNDEGVFASSSIANSVKTKLQKSLIYNLIVTKQKFDRTVEAGFIDDIEYNKLMAEYSDLLMHPRITTILPPEFVGADKLLDNPEYELQRIFDKKNKIHIDKNEDEEKISKLDITVYYAILVYYTLIFDYPIYLKSLILGIITFGYCKFMVLLPANSCHVLNENIRKKIQDHFFHKHAAICAYNTPENKIIYWFIWTLLFVWSALFVCFCIYFNGNYFDYFVASAFFVIIIFVSNAFANRNHNSFFPRICIALIASWLLIAFSDDFIASQLFIKDWLIWIMSIIVSTIICLILYFESREFSPYYCDLSQILTKYFWQNFRRNCNRKILPIFSFALFTSFLIGIIVQVVVFEKLIASSNVLPAVTFSENFLALDTEKDSLQLLLLLDTTTLESNQRKEIQYKIIELDKFRTKYSNTDSLLKVLCTNDSLSLCSKDKQIYDKFFGSIPQKVCVKIKMPLIGDAYLFPRALVFHSFIVLLLSFIV